MNYFKAFIFWIALIASFIWFVKENRVERVYHTCDWIVIDFAGSLDGNDYWGIRCEHGYEDGHWCYSCGDIEGDTLINYKGFIVKE